MARMYALHNLKVLVIGLDYQMDISNMLSGGYLNKDDDELSLEEIDKSPQVKGLYDLAMGNATLEEIIQPTEIQTLHFIPETANLNILSEFLTSKNKREYWLNTNVIQKIKSDYDLILLDLGPSWSLLTSNALVATDVLVSPVETKILHYQNIKNFVTYLDNFQKQMELNFKTVYIPTKFSPTKKLSSSIRKYYLTNLPTTNTSIRESNQIEEANAQYLSVIETSPASLIASETRELLKEIFDNYVADNTKSVENKSWH
jgi:chromosome partitioning protein